MLKPDRIVEDLWASWRTQVLVTSIELDLFTHLATGRQTPKAIARSTQAPEKGVERLLNTLVGLGYLNKKRKRYTLKPLAKEFLVRGKDSYRGDMAQIARLQWESLSRLTDVVRSGRPVESVDVEERGRTFFPTLVAALFPGNFAGGQAAVTAQLLELLVFVWPCDLAFDGAQPRGRIRSREWPEAHLLHTCWPLSGLLPAAGCDRLDRPSRK